MTITRPPSMSQHEMDMLFERLANRGAKIELKDPRVTSMQTWLLGIIGTAVVGGLGWGIATMNDLNKNVAVLIQQNAYADRINMAQDARLDIYDARLRDVERSHGR